MISKTLSHIVFSFLLVQLSFAQSNLGARLDAMAGTGTAIKDIWNTHGNFAGITAIKTPTASASFVKYFFDAELNKQAIAAVIPIKNTAFGFGFQRYGIAEYLEINTKFGVAKSFGERFSIGLNGNYYQVKIENYGAVQQFNFDLGFQYGINDELDLGILLLNPAKLSYRTHANLTIPSSYQVGLAYQVSNKVLLASTVKKELDHAIDILSGIEYQIVDFLFLRGGISMKPFKQYIGIGFSTVKFNIDVSLENYISIGYVPQISLAYAF